MELQSRRRRFYRHLWTFVLLGMLLDRLPKKAVERLLELLRYVPFGLGLGMRYCLVKRLCRQCGDDVLVFPGAFLSFLENCEIGHHVSIHENCNIGCKGGLIIGSNVMISQGASILTTEHNYLQLAEFMRDAPQILKSTAIGDDVWVGAHAVITAGVRVGSGSVVAAGSVVVRDVEPFSIVGGVPARVIGSRK